jgi:hypothetical protein
MPAKDFRNTYDIRDGDVIAQRLGENRWEVCMWRGSLEKGEWTDRPPLSTAELNKTIRARYEFLGEHGGWQYYRPR